MILIIRRRWLQVRCSNLQELVYKQGQAGITKATVSITFDNSNRATSPTGYEDKQKITVTRQVRLSACLCRVATGAQGQANGKPNAGHAVHACPSSRCLDSRETASLCLR